MQLNWEKAIDFVLRMEVGDSYSTLEMGAYENNPADPGGETKWGVSKRAYPNLDIKGLSLEDAKKIYFSDYWNAVHGDELCFPFDVIAFDIAVNEGVGEAKKLLQMALDVNVDGKIGDDTIRASFKASPRRSMLFLGMRIRHYNQIILAKPSSEVFDLDWAFRVISLAKLIFSA